MTLTISPPLEFRPAYADEFERCSFIDARLAWSLPESRWYVAVQSSGRIVAAIRYWIGWPTGDAATIEFRLTLGAGKEAMDHRTELLRRFLSFVDPQATADVCYQPRLPKGSGLEEPLILNGFHPIYHEHHLRVIYPNAVKRITSVVKTLRKRPGKWSEARIVPLRRCDIRQVQPLLERFSLMSGEDLAKAWNSPDPKVLDRDASACLFFGDDLAGVIIAKDAGKELHVPAIAVDHGVTGARIHANPLLMHHVIMSREPAGYDYIVWRANSEAARQTVNMTVRGGGEIVGESRLWGRKPDPCADPSTGRP